MPPSKTKKQYTSKQAPGGPGDEEVVSTEGLSFELDGVTFDLHGQFDGQDMIDLAMPLADAGDGWYEPEALAAVGRFYQQVMGEETYRAFSRHRRKQRTHPQVVAQIMTDLIEELTDRPPGKLSRSPAGPPPVVVSSPVVSSSPGWAAAAVDPEGIIPREMAGEADVVLAPPPGQEPAADPMAGMARVINLGDPARTRVEPIQGGEASG